MTILNAAAALKVAGIVNDLKEGAKQAAEAIDSGRAKQKLEQLIEISKELEKQGP